MPAQNAGLENAPENSSPGNSINPEPFVAALSASNLSMFDLGAEVAIDRSVEKAIYALLLDPLTAAACTPAQIKAMALELFAAEKAFLPDYS